MSSEAASSAREARARSACAAPHERMARTLRHQARAAFCHGRPDVAVPCLQAAEREEGLARRWYTLPWSELRPEPAEPPPGVDPYDPDCGFDWESREFLVGGVRLPPREPTEAMLATTGFEIMRRTVPPRRPLVRRRSHAPVRPRARARRAARRGACRAGPNSSDEGESDPPSSQTSRVASESPGRETARSARSRRRVARAEAPRGRT